MTAPPIRLSHSLTRMNMLVSGTALVLACIAFATYDLISFRDLLLRQAAFQALVTAAASDAALEFGDEVDAAEALAPFAELPEVVAAQLYTDEGVLAAHFPPEASTPPGPALAIPDGAFEAHRFSSRTLTVARRVTVGDRLVGTLVVESSLDSLYARARRYLVIVVGVLFVSLLAALLVSRRVQRSISKPLADLADVARRVSAGKDYAWRAASATGASYEVQSAITSFNDMLGQIQERDRSLLAARDELENRVIRRTEELDQINRELEAFSYSVSHDLRAPLRHVAGFAALLEQHAGSALDDRARGYLKTITEAASRMGRLIDDLLAFSRMGRASMTPQPVDLGRLVREARAEVGPETTGREIVWNIQPLPAVHADPALLRPVLVNLLSNAVKYSSPRPVATVDVGAERLADGTVKVWVRDNGVGFDMQYAGKLFGVFQRLHRADEFTGTGIGLANVRRIITRHGGRTWAEAVPHKGATFYFTLPAANPEP